jgi:arginine decarboxylase
LTLTFSGSFIHDAIQPHAQGLRCHVPGHAGRWLGQNGLLPDGAFHLDVTELEGLDVLSEPSGCLAQAQDAYAEACQVSKTFFLTQGSTTGLQAAMLACGLTEADTMLLPRNAHRSVMGGLILTGTRPAWFTPRWQSDWGLWQGVNAADLPPTPPPGTKALLVTSPTYEGLTSDLPALATYCQQHQLFFLVDEAHGALFPFYGVTLKQGPGGKALACLPVSACHKTLGSLTQTAVLHLPHGSRLAVDAVQQAINVLHTSSPSYPLLLSMDAMRAHWQQHPPHSWWQQVQHLRQQLATLPHIRLYHTDDPSRLVIQYPPHLHDWAVWLEATHGIPYEALTDSAAVYVWGVGLQQADSQRFMAAMAKLAHWQPKPLPPVKLAWNHNWPIDQALTPRQAFFSAGQSLPASKAIGRIARQTVVHCPPGVPILCHGERIQAYHIPLLPPDINVVAYTHSSN